MANTATTKHPFGELLAQYRARKSGFTQTRLAELTGYDQAIVTRMAQGKKDLTGPSGRERIIRIIETLIEQNCLITLDEANALLLAAQMPPLFELQPAEAKLIARLTNTPAGTRTRRTNLPALISSFIGRATESAEVRQLLITSRLVTLTGSGGAGKTRLAQRVAGDVLLNYADGVWYVELAALTDKTMIADAAIRALGLVMSDQPALERLTEHLCERHALLVLDNCEHLIDAVAEFAIAVLQACPRVTILATSREAMNVEGESAWRVPPMQPDEASRLFVERATAARNAFSTEDEIVAYICRRLDGMPLAIELAASRLQVMSLSNVATRLDDRFNLLAHGRRGALPRHQTLRAMLDWSYQLLSEDEQIAFCRLGIFVGGWELDLAESLIGKDALAMLTQLVNKSLVRVDETSGHTRYHYLETIREYALEMLHKAGELHEAQRHHAEAIAALAERAEKPMRGPEQKLWVDRITRDLANLFAALTWSFGSAGDALTGCRIVSVLKVIWLSSATLNAKYWINTAFAVMTDDMPARVRASLYRLHGHYCFDGTFQDMIPHFERALRLFEAAQDQAGIADAMFNIAQYRLEVDCNDADTWQMMRRSIQLADDAGDADTANLARVTLANWTHFVMRFDEAEAMLREHVLRCEAQHDLSNLSKSLWCLGHLLAERMLFNESAAYFQASGQIAEQIQNPYDQMHGYTCAAEIIRFTGNLSLSLEMLETQLAFARAHLPRVDQVFPTMLLAKALNEAGERDRAMALLIECLKIYDLERISKPIDFSHLFEVFGFVHSNIGNALKAALMFGFADACIVNARYRRWAHNVWEFAPFIAKARAALGDEAYDAAHAKGYALTIRQAIAYTLNQS